MQEAKTREQQVVEEFQGLSLAETVQKLRDLGIKVRVEEGYVVLVHPFLPRSYERTYPETLLKVRGTNNQDNFG